ncbi:HK97 gp10 family phage protein [Enterococcus olivae]
MNRLRRKLKQIPKIAKEAAIDATSDVVDLTQIYAVQNVQSQSKHPTGELAQSIKTEVAEDVSGNVVGRVWSDKKQAFFKEFGTGPVGQESPKDLPPGIVLSYRQTRWFFPTSYVDRDLSLLYGMLTVSIKEVDFYMTRGQPASPWLYPALKDASKEAPGIFKETLNRYMKEGLK